MKPLQFAILGVLAALVFGGCQGTSPALNTYHKMRTQPFSPYDDSYDNMTYAERRALQKRRGAEHLYDARNDNYRKGHKAQNGVENGDGFYLREDAHAN